MWRRIREPFGTAGLIVAVVALVAALAGGAYAASGALTGKQKKEVEKIAKKFAGNPGATGATGPQGAAGAKGDAGSPGTNGVNGENGAKGDTGAPGEKGEKGDRGANGTSPIVTELQPDPSAAKCKAGGAKIVGADGVEAFACNGEGGGGGEGYPETLPSGKTETGFWEVLGENGIVSGEFAVTTISFPLRLAQPPSERIMISATSTPEEIAKCPGSFLSPEADSAGVLCLYSGESRTVLSAGLNSFGAFLFLPKTEVGLGTWAVKDPLVTNDPLGPSTGERAPRSMGPV